METIRKTATTLALTAALLTGAGDTVLEHAGYVRAGASATLEAQGQAPNTPTYITASFYGNGKMNLHWRAAAGPAASNYEVRWKIGNDTFNSWQWVRYRYHNIENTTPGSVYTIEVRAQNSHGRSAAGAVTTSTNYEPAQVQNFRAEGKPEAVGLWWNLDESVTGRGGENALWAKFEYRQKTAGTASWGSWQVQSRGITTSMLIKGLTVGQSYDFQVRASNQDYTGPESDVATATAAPLPPMWTLRTQSTGVERGGRVIQEGDKCGSDGATWMFMNRRENAPSDLVFNLFFRVNGTEHPWSWLHDGTGDTITITQGTSRTSYCLIAKNDDDSTGIVRNADVQGHIIARPQGGGTDVTTTRELTVSDGDPKPKVDLSVIWTAGNGDEKESASGTIPEGTDFQVKATLNGARLDTTAEVHISRENPSDMTLSGETGRIDIAPGDESGTSRTFRKVNDADHDGDGWLHFSVNNFGRHWDRGSKANARINDDEETETDADQRKKRNVPGPTGPARLSVRDAEGKEARANNGTIQHVVFNVKIVPALNREVVVNYRTSDEVDDSHTDHSHTKAYVPATGSLTFAAGETTKRLTVTVQDTDATGDTRFTLHLDPQDDALEDTSARGKVIDRNIGIYVRHATVRESGDGTNSIARVEVALRGRNYEHMWETDATFDWTTMDDTAVAGEDYVASSGSGTIAAPLIKTYIEVPIIDDDVEDSGEKFKIVISNPGPEGVGLDHQWWWSFVTINNDDTPVTEDTDPNVSIDDAAANEGDGNLVFTVSLDAGSEESVTVAYTTSDGTATAGEDYTTTNGSVTFDPGDTEKSVSVPITDDETDENDEDLTLTLSSAAGAEIDDGTATGTIHDDDGEESAETESSELSIANASADEDDGEIEFTVTLDPAADDTVTVDYATSDGSAEAGDDYTAKSGTLTFSAGDTEKTIAVAIADDGNNEDEEDLTVTLSNASGAEIDGGSATGTIRDDDEPAVAVTTLTGAFHGVPASHDGTTFTFEVEFSENIAGGYQPLRDHSFDVEEGDVQRAQRVNGRNDRWKITVKPDGDDDVAITLKGNRSCSTTGAICDKATSTRQLSQTLQATVAGPEEVSTEPLTMTVSNVPSEHDDSSFEVSVTFSEEVETNASNMRYYVVAAEGGEVTGASRQTSGSNIGWNVKITPDLRTAVEIEIQTTTRCDYPGGICTADGRMLETGFKQTVLARAGLSVSDATVTEGAGAILGFTIGLSRATGYTITADYATEDGTATAGSDYTATSGTVTFTAGETAKTVDVVVLEDSINEGNETMTLKITSATRATFHDYKGTGTIENHDALPIALVVRFGRAMGSHVVEQVEQRMAAPRTPGLDGTIGGMPLRGGGLHMGRGNHGYQRPHTGPGRNATGGTRAGLPTAAQSGSYGPSGVGRRQHGDQGEMAHLLESSAFELTQKRGGNSMSFWSRSGSSWFGAQDSGLDLNGDVRTSTFGADYARGRTITGIAIAHSRGHGSWAGPDSGTMQATTTGVYPWIGYQASDRLSFWTVTGYGAGGLSVHADRGGPLETGLSMSMAAGGGRAEIAGIAGFRLAVKSDALWVGTSVKSSVGDHGRLEEATASIHRIRAALEGSRSVTFGNRIALTPSVELGVRADGGDADTGHGLDIAVGIGFSDTVSGVGINLRARRLIVHQDAGFTEGGMSLGVTYDPTPGTPTGFSARIAPGWGTDTMSGAETLWQNEMIAGQGGYPQASGGRLDAQAGYGIRLGKRLVGTPHGGIQRSGHGRFYRAGYKIGLTSQETLQLEVGAEIQQQESSWVQSTYPAQGSNRRYVAQGNVRW